jgi:hypothetical protein
MVSPVLLAGLAIALLSPATASAGTIYTLDSSDPNSGFAGPYGTVTVQLQSSTEATITFQALNNLKSGGGYYLISGTDMFDLDINGTVNQSLTTATAISPLTPNPTQPTFTYGDKNVDGIGTYFVRVQGGNATDALSTLTLDVFLSSGSWSSSAQVLAVNDKGEYVGGHVYAYDNSSYTGGANATYYEADTSHVNTNDTPAPASAVLLGIGVLSLAGGGVVRRIRGRQPVAA